MRHAPQRHVQRMIHVEMGKGFRRQQRVRNIHRQQFTQRTAAAARRHFLLHLRERDGARQAAAIHHGPGIVIGVQKPLRVLHALGSGQHA